MKRARPFQKRPVLIIQHAPHEHPAALRRALESQGIPTLWIHPYLNEAYPAVKEIAGMISLGGPMGANDELEFPWITREIEALRASVEADLPTVGICLGGQMLSRALGGRVEKNTTYEVGWFPIELNPEGLEDPVMGAAGANPTVYHWHGDTFHLPEGAVLLGKSKACARQAFRFGEKAYGFQFHPEADHQLVLEWLSIEGVEEEIQHTRKSHGARTVQAASTQRNYAMKGEKGSLKIAAAIGALFSRTDVEETSATRLKEIEGWITRHALVALEFDGPGGARVQLRGHIVSHLSISAGDFIIFQENTTLLWPIRIGDIRKVTEALP